jgi:hypothetical protein
MEFYSCKYNFLNNLTSSLLRCTVSFDHNYIVNLKDPLINSQSKNRYLVGVTDLKSGLFRILPKQNGILKKLFFVEEDRNRIVAKIGYGEGTI